MKELIESLSISGFRGFSNVTIPTFGKVNLITRKNNTGKSSLLEANRILVTRGSIGTLQSILNYREESNEVNFERKLRDFGSYRNGSRVRHKQALIQWQYLGIHFYSYSDCANYA